MSIIRRKSTLYALCLSLTLTLALFGTWPSTILAGKANPEGPKPSGVICVEGLVINHEEQPIDGWVVVATFIANNGELEHDNALHAVSGAAPDGQTGTFYFEDGLFPGNWQFSIELQDSWEPVTPDRFDIELNYGSDECVQIRFKLRQLVDVIVIKINDYHTLLPGWTIHATPGADNHFAQAKSLQTDSEGRALFRLTPGEWIFTEEAPANTRFEPVIPNDGSQTLDVTPPGPHVIRFKNRILHYGCIEAFKFDVPPEGTETDSFGLEGWEITVLRTDGSVEASGQTDAFGHIKFEELPLGPYTVVEESRSGWRPVTPASFDITLNGYGCQTITFYNEQVAPHFCIEGRKIDANGGYGLPGWQIEATPLAEGGYTPVPVVSNGTGHFKITLPANDYRIPNAEYEICEIEQDGWVSQGPVCQTVTLPEKPEGCVMLPEEFVNAQVGHLESEQESEPSEEPEASASSDTDHYTETDDYDINCTTTHTVKPGENIRTIRLQYGLSIQEILDANPSVQKQPHYYIHAGQEICVE